MKKLFYGILSFFNVKAGEIYKAKLAIYDMKDKYVKVVNHIVEMRKTLTDVKAKQKVAKNDIRQAKYEYETTATQIKSIEINDTNASKFMTLKNRLDSKKEKMNLLEKNVDNYDSIIKRLETGIAKSESLAEKLQYKIEYIETKKNMATDLGEISAALEELGNGEDDMITNITMNEIDHDSDLAIARFEVTAEDDAKPEMSVDEMKKYVEGL